MPAQRLESFADLAQVRHRFDPAPPASTSTPSAVEHPRVRQLEAGRIPPAAPHSPDTRLRCGWIAFLTGPHAGFVTDFGASCLTTKRERALAFVFPNRTALDRALALALGMNRRSYNVEVLPVGSNS